MQQYAIVAAPSCSRPQGTCSGTSAIRGASETPPGARRGGPAVDCHTTVSRSARCRQAMLLVVYLLAFLLAPLGPYSASTEATAPARLRAHARLFALYRTLSLPRAARAQLLVVPARVGRMAAPRVVFEANDPFVAGACARPTASRGPPV